MRKKKPEHRNKKKIRTIIVSILLAIVVWFMVVYVSDPDITTTLTDLKITFVGEGELREHGYVITGRDDIPMLSASVTGKRSDFMNYMNDITVQIDVSGINTPGEYQLRGSVVMPTTRIQLEKEKYRDIPITVEPIAEKEIEVHVKQTGIARDKFVKSVISNSKVKVRGAQSEIENIASAEATVDISRMREDNIAEATYVLLDADGTLISKNETVEAAHETVEIENTVYSVRSLPVTAVLSAQMDKEYTLSNVTVTPSEISVGVKDGAEEEQLVVYIDRDDTDNAEYEISEENNLYIPQNNKKVRIKANLERKHSESAE